MKLYLNFPPPVSNCWIELGPAHLAQQMAQLTGERRGNEGGGRTGRREGARGGEEGGRIENRSAERDDPNTSACFCSNYNQNTPLPVTNFKPLIHAVDFRRWIVRKS